MDHNSTTPLVISVTSFRNLNTQDSGHDSESRDSSIDSDSYAICFVCSTSHVLTNKVPESNFEIQVADLISCYLFPQMMERK